MYGPGDPIEERKRALLQRLSGARGGRGRGEFEGRGMGRGVRGGPPVGIMSMLGAMGDRRGGIGRGGLGGAFQVRPAEPGDFPNLPPQAQGPPETWQTQFLGEGYGNMGPSHPYMPDPPSMGPPQHPWVPPWLRLNPPPPPPPRFTPY